MRNKIFLSLLIIFLIINNGCLFKSTSIVKINSEPYGAEVFIKSLSKDKDLEWVNLGETPIETEIEKGEYKIRIEKDNYLIQRKVIEISENKENFEFRLEKVPVMYVKDFPFNYSSSYRPFVKDSYLIFSNIKFNIYNGEGSFLKILNEDDLKNIKSIVGPLITNIILSYKTIEVHSFIDTRVDSVIILFLDKENKKPIGKLTTYPILNMEMGLQDGNKVYKTYIEYSDFILGKTWNKELKGYYQFISLLDKKLYFITKEYSYRFPQLNTNSEIVIINSRDGKIEERIQLNKFIDIDNLYSFHEDYEEDKLDKIYFLERRLNNYKFKIFDLNKRNISNKFEIDLDFEIEKIYFYEDRINIYNEFIRKGILIDKHNGRIIKSYNFQKDGEISDLFATKDFLFITTYKNPNLSDLALLCYDIDSNELIFKYNEFPIRDIIDCYKDSILLVTKQCYVGTSIIAINLDKIKS